MEWDHELAEELAYCVPLGLEHCKFLGWCEGCQAKALAWSRRERERCHGCGIHPSDAGEDPVAFVGWVTHCDWCEALEQEKRNIPEEQASPAWKVSLVRRQAAEQMMASGEGIPG